MEFQLSSPQAAFENGRGWAAEAHGAFSSHVGRQAPRPLPGCLEPIQTGPGSLSQCLACPCIAPVPVWHLTSHNRQ